MSSLHAAFGTPRRRQRGMTITEAVIGMLVLAVAIGGAMQATTVARVESIAADDRSVARGLVAVLRSEIDALRYSDPQSVGSTIGADAGESATLPSGWDDVDDANGWSGSSLLASMPTGWTLAVTVAFADTSDPTVDRTTETGLKRITVEAKRNSRVIHKETWLRARS